MNQQKSRFERVICLRSWWLVKSQKSFDGKQLAVAGYTNREKEARRIFTSAPIRKRYDDFNIETVDGISVNLDGFIDKARTEYNGFSSEIFQHFLFGFPAWWEECAKKYLCKEHTNVNLSGEEIEKKSPDVHENTPAHAEVPIVSPEAATQIKAASSQADEEIAGCLVSSNADEDQYLNVETFQRNNSFARNVENQDAKQGEAITKRNQQIRPKKCGRASRNSRSVKNDLTEITSKISVTIDVNLSRREAEKELAHVNESTPIHDTIPIVSPETATTSGIEAAPPQAVAYEDVLPGCLVSSNVDEEDQYLSVETVHDTVPTVSPETDTTSGIEAASLQAEHETAYENIVPGGLDSTNGDKDQYLSVETVQRDHSSASFVDKLDDAKQREATAKRNRHARSSRNSRSVKNDLTSSVKGKRSFTADVNLSKREAEKKSLHMNESTPIRDLVPIISSEDASFRRSRSGRLLLPALEHWRNQRPVFDKDRKIVGVMNLLDHEHLDIGDKSEPPKKRRKLQ